MSSVLVHRVDGGMGEMWDFMTSSTQRSVVILLQLWANRARQSPQTIWETVEGSRLGSRFSM